MSDSDDDNFCFYGKALEPYDEDAVPKKKPISVEDQIATDAQGRRRFHGAFTGGFSAGFYNTVGSLEGWKPSEFKSSRSEKALSKHSKPEDYMDDEDVGEHGFAPQTVKATSDYASSRKRKRQMFSDGPIPGEPVLHTLITSGNETVGYLLMKNMDLKQSNKSNAESSKVYGCVMPKPYEIKRNQDFDDAEPTVYISYVKNPKSNSFGLGYEGLDKTHLNFFKSTQLVVKDKDNKKLSISGQAFGVGAFENEDEDIYAKDDMTQYDFELTSEKKAATKSTTPGGVFSNFVISKSPLLRTKIFDPPTIPHSFSGKHKVKKSRFEPLVEEKVERKDMTATIRAKYIGEEDIHSPQASTSQQNSRNHSTTINNTLSENKIKKNEAVISPLITNFKPEFSIDILNDKFVSASQAEDPHNILEEVKKSEENHGTQEMRDAAKLKMYGPLTRVVIDWQPCSLLCKRFNVKEPLLDERIKTNERKKNHIIFEYQKNNEEITLQPGLSSTKSESTPIDSTSLDAESNRTTTDLKTVESKMDANVECVKEETMKDGTTTTPGKDKEIIEEEKNTVLDPTERIDVSKNINLFKAVFLSSSESESEEDEKQKEEEEVKSREDMMKENVLNDYLIPKIKSTKEGILSHIKFNPLVRKKIPETDQKETEQKEEVQNTSKQEECETSRDINTYGPALPTQLQIVTHTYNESVEIDEDWVEKDKVVSRKAPKHKKKHKKEKRHKKQHKSKRRH